MIAFGVEYAALYHDDNGIVRSGVPCCNRSIAMFFSFSVSFVLGFSVGVLSLLQNSVLSSVRPSAVFVGDVTFVSERREKGE
jgi:hypothetical protein